jgi:hypothetical protein
MFGRLLLQKTIESPKNNMELSELPDATYLLEILDGNNNRAGLWRIQKIR